MELLPCSRSWGQCYRSRILLLVDLLLGVALLVTIAVLLTGMSHVFVGAPYVPTPRVVMRAMLELAALRGDEVVYDLGAGDARFLLEAVRRHPGIRAEGWEIVPTVWLLGRLRIWWAGLPVQLHRANALRAPLGDADVIFLYLTPPLMAELGVRFAAQLRPGTLVVSHCFTLPGKEPVQTRQVRAWGRDKTLYLYRY